MEPANSINRRLRSKMIRHLVVFNALVFNGVDSAAHTDVNVAGTTLGSGYSRSEGMVTYRCPATHPFACAGGTKCSSEYFKPTSGTESDCDGGVLNVYSQCCPSDAIPCRGHPGLCKNHLTNGTLCPSTHPHPFSGGSKCCADPWKPSSGSHSDCDGGRLEVGDECCTPGKATFCRKDSDFKCRTNPVGGELCPTTHPYPCQGGAKCSSTPWKAPTGTESDCDGKRLLSPSGSLCCPSDTSLLVDCAGDDTGRHKCAENQSSKRMVNIGNWWDESFYFMDVRRECVGAKVHPNPDVSTAGRAMKFVKGRAVVCGGWVDPTYTDKCYAYTPYAGWEYVGSVPWPAYRYASFVLDEGTSGERLYIAGGYNYTASMKYENRVVYYDGTSITLDTGGMSPMPTGGYAHNFFQLDHDRVLRIGGRNNQAPITNAHVYYRSNTSWVEVISDTTAACAEPHMYTGADNLIGTEAILLCYNLYYIVIVDTDTFAMRREYTVTRHTHVFPFFVNRHMYFVYRSYKPDDLAISMRRDMDTGEWTEIFASVTDPHINPQFPVTARIPDDWFSC